MPDGVLSNQKSQFGQILDCLGMEKVGVFLGHLLHFMAIRKFSINLVYLSQFKKNLATLLLTIQPSNSRLATSVLIVVVSN
jgi:hypothetical protein